MPRRFREYSKLRAERHFKQTYKQELNRIEEQFSRAEKAGKKDELLFHLHKAVFPQIEEIIAQNKPEGSSPQSYYGKKHNLKVVMDKVFNKGFGKHPVDSPDGPWQVEEKIRDRLERLSSGSLREATEKFYRNLDEQHYSEDTRQKVLLGKKGSDTKVFRIITVITRKKTTHMIMLNPDFLKEEIDRRLGEA